jgi:hypothetical protein
MDDFNNQQGYDPNAYQQPQGGYDPNAYQQPQGGYDPNMYQQSQYNSNMYQQPQQPQQSSGLGIASMVCGIDNCCFNNISVRILKTNMII